MLNNPAPIMRPRNPSGAVICPAAARLSISTGRPKAFNRNEREALHTRLRVRELRRRAEENKKDPLHFYPTPLTDSEAETIASGLSNKPAEDGEVVIGLEWRRMIGREIARTVKMLIKNNL
jgi:hypothetical protein